MTDVVIAGGGPGGATLALLLAQRGVDVTLVERHADFSREFRGERLMPAGIEVLRALGLGPRLDALPQRRIEGTEVFVDGRRRYGFSFAEGDAPTYLPQPPLLETIVAAAADHPGFTLLRGTVARDVVRNDVDRVVGLVVDDGSGARVVEADLTVAADGRASTVRRKAGFALPSAPPEAYDVVWLAGPPPDGEGAAAVARIYLSGAGAMVFTLPTPDGSMQLGVVIDKGGFGELRRDDAWFDLIAATCPPGLVDHLDRHRERLSVTALDVVCHHLERWWQPGLLLLGDAAHPMSPMGGQGIGMALRDAVVAGNHLVPALHTSGDVAGSLDRACARIQDERRIEVDRIQAMQRRSVPLFRQQTVTSRALARHVAPLLARLAPGLLARAIGGRPEMVRGVTEVAVAA